MDIVKHFADILQPTDEVVALHAPQFVGAEWQYVKDCIDTGWVSSVGRYVDLFEERLAAITGANYAIATVNGTAALHILYQLAGITAHDEVLVPTLTFIGTLNPLMYCGAIPHFIDAEEKYLGIDVEKLRDYLKEIAIDKKSHFINKYTQRPLRALCVMHTLGHPVDLEPLAALCDEYRLILLEDAAEALGSTYRTQHVGHYGLGGALSFNGNKILTTGGGGAILLDDRTLAKRAKHLTTTAKIAHPYLYQHDAIGYNYRLPNINAALGCAQLEMLPTFLAQKREIAFQYAQATSALSGYRFLSEPTFARSNYWLNAILLDQPDINLRNQLLEAFTAANIQVRPLWELQHTLPMFSEYPRMPIEVANKLLAQVITLPSSANLQMATTMGAIANG